MIHTISAVFYNYLFFSPVILNGVKNLSLLLSEILRHKYLRMTRFNFCHCEGV